MTALLHRAAGGVLVLLAVVVPLIFDPGAIEAYDDPKATAVRAGALLYALLLLLAGGRRERTRGTTGRPGGRRFPTLFLPAVLLWGLAAASSLWAVSPTETLRELALLTAPLVLYALVATAPRRAVPVRAIRGALVVASTTVALLGLLQWLGSDRLPADFLPGADAFGTTFGSHSMAAQFLVLALPLGVALGLTARGWLRAAAPLASSAAMALYLLVAGTRSVWVAVALAWTAVGLGLWMWWRREGAPPSLGISLRRPAVVLIALGLVVGGIFVASGVSYRDPIHGKTDLLGRILSIVRIHHGSTRERLMLWENTAEMVRSHPLLGVGYGNWKIVYPRFSQGRAETGVAKLGSHRQPFRAHNDYLQELAEGGVVGLLAFLALIGGGILLAASAIRRAPRGRERALAAALAAGALSICIEALFAFPFRRDAPFAFLFLTWGILERGPRAGRPPHKTRATRGALALACLVSVGPVAIAALDWRANRYQRTGSLLRFDGAARMVLGDARGSMDAFARSLEAFEEGSRLQPWNFRFALEHAFVLAQASVFARGDGKDEEARRLLERAAGEARRALTWHPNFMNARNDLGNYLKRLGRYDEAEAEYRKALAISPHYESAKLNLASLLVLLGRYDEAGDLAGQVLFLDSDSVAALRIAGEISFQRGRLERAVEFFSEILLQDPSHDVARRRVAQCLLKLEDYEGALAYYRRRLPARGEGRSPRAGSGPEGSLVAEALVASIGAGDERWASAMAHAFLGSSRGATRAFFELANEELKKGRYQMAEACYRILLDVVSSHADAHCNRGIALRFLGRTAEAEVEFRQALSLDPRDPESRHNLGTLLQSLGRAEEAQRLLRPARQDAPGDE